MAGFEPASSCSQISSSQPAGRGLMSPDVAFTWDNAGLTAPYVAQYLCTLAPTLAPTL